MTGTLMFSNDDRTYAARLLSKVTLGEANLITNSKYIIKILFYTKFKS